METPSSTKRVTRSQTMAAALTTTTNNNIPASRKIEDTEKGVSKSRRRNAKQQQQQDRSALIDITNDSPIVGLAMGILETPSSAIAKQRSNKGKNKNTPGSGEALLRGQVKTLLQRVEEEAELSKLSLENRPFLHLQGFANSPMGLLAPTPANTPQVPNLSGDGDNGLVSVTPLLVVEEQLKICQVASDICDGKNQGSLESQKSLTRSLMLDFSEKSESSDSSECSSVVTDQGVEIVASDSKDKSSPPTDDDNASIWSIQVNASTHDEEEEEVIEGEEDYYHEEYQEEEDDDYEEDDDDDDEGLLDKLCEGISKISVKENTMGKFAGRHTRFVYNSDDEMVETVDSAKTEDCSDGVLHLKGLPTPKGKHMRFSIDEVEEE